MGAPLRRGAGDLAGDLLVAQLGGQVVVEQLKFLQWGIPILTGAMLNVNARVGEQQRPAQVTGGMFRRLLPSAKAA